jgi:pimeloyl-ACP methyl ester carboxylesterase
VAIAAVRVQLPPWAQITDPEVKTSGSFVIYTSILQNYTLETSVFFNYTAYVLFYLSTYLKMTLRISFFALLLTPFLFTTLAYAQTTDLDHDGIFDHEDPEVIATTSQSLPAGEYVFQNLTIASGTQLKLISDSSVEGEYQGVKIIAENVVVEDGAYISANGTGYTTDEGPGVAPSSSYSEGGAGYGGTGGQSCSHGSCRRGGPTYGSSLKPKDLGSNRGGGAIWIDVSDTFTNNGAVTSNGRNRGSGGSIFVEAKNLTGGGIFSANGGTTKYDFGGGGRIAIYYEQNSFTGDIDVSAFVGVSGTVCFLDVIKDHLYIYDTWNFVAQDTPYLFEHISILEGASVKTDEGVSVQADTLLVDGGSLSFVGADSVTFSSVEVRNNGNVTLSGDELLTIESVEVIDGASLSHAREGKLYLDVESLFVGEGAVISADRSGYLTDEGPGVAPSSAYSRGGAGYGGTGGKSCSHGSCRIGGSTYGSETEPTDLGSDGGGGYIRIIADSITNNGVVSANGGHRGSGGSVYVTTRSLSGSGLFSATNGGTQYDIGGGGRIAIYYDISSFNGSIDVSATNAGDGTVVFEQVGSAPVLSYVSGSEYADDVVNPALHPNRGVANEDELTFKVQYTDVDGTEAEEVKLVVQNVVDFSTEFYNQHIVLSNEAVLVEGDGGNNLDQGVMYVGNKNSGNAITSNESIAATLLRPGVRTATTTFVVTKSPLAIGEVYADITLEAINESGAVVANKSTRVTIGSDDSNAVAANISVSAPEDIAVLRFVVEETNDTGVWIEKYNLEALYDMQSEDGAVFTFATTFPKGEYQHHFVAQSVDGKTARLPEVTETLNFTTGYSSVAFLPGIKSSRLYVDETRLWESHVINLQQLEMFYDGITGKSTLGNIYTKDVIDEGFGLRVGDDVYRSFIDSMDKYKETGLISDWKPLAYDWRLDFDSVLEGGYRDGDNIFYGDTYATNTPYILQELERLAKSSDSGKVTIVSHSMGGLIAKKLLYELENGTGREPYTRYSELLGKIDTVVLVASPQLGTPQAIASMLHGYDESIFYGIVSDSESSRQLAYTMQSAYNLLPSEMYTEVVSDLDGQVFRPADSALIAFSESVAGNINNAHFVGEDVIEYYNTNYNESLSGTTTIRSYSAMRDFLEGNDGRSSTLTSELNYPLTFENRTSMLEGARELHQSIDNWQSPDTNGDGNPDIRVVQIAGWGSPETIKGMTYFAKQDGLECRRYLRGTCVEYAPNWVLDIRPEFTIDGDKVVVLPSAVAMGEVSKLSDYLETYYIDLYNHNAGFAKDRTHSSIFEVDEVQDLIKNIILIKEDPIAGLIYIKSDKNNLPSNDVNMLRLSMHSPVDVHIYDEHGNHVGLSASSTDSLERVDKEIPNAYYLEFGEGKYLGVPVDDGQTYTVELNGTGSGVFTFEMSNEVGGEVVSTQTFSDVPVSTTTKATLSISSLADVYDLKLDQDGDGDVDVIVLTQAVETDITFQSIRDEFKKMPRKISRPFIQQVRNAEKQARKENWFVAQKQLEAIERQLTMYARKPFGVQVEEGELLRVSAMLNVMIEKMAQEHENKILAWKEMLRGRIDSWR